MSRKLRTIAIILTIAALPVMFMMKGGESKIKSYYAGDAINYNDRLFVGTTNSGYLEVFELRGSDLKLLSKIKPAEPTWQDYQDFNAMVFSVENGELFAYAGSAWYTFKYYLGDPQNPRLVKQVRDTTWDWVGSMEMVNGRLATLGSKGIKIFDRNLTVIDRYNVSNETNPHNIEFSSDGKFIVNINEGKLHLFDRRSRQQARFWAVDADEPGNKQAYLDDRADWLYVVDDKAVKKFSLAGGLYKTLKHDSGLGYDVIPSADRQHIYISNGTSIGKLDKDTLKMVDGFENNYLPTARNWAMDLAAVSLPQGERVVIFNNSNILVLDKNLDYITHVEATETEEDAPAPLEDLFIKIDKNRAAPLSPVSVYAGGFRAGENLTIKFGKTEYKAVANEEGRVSKKVYVPMTDKRRVDITVKGMTSARSYSISFKVEQPNNK